MGVAFHLPVLEEHMTRFENEANLNLEVRHMLIYLCWKSIYFHLPVLEEHMLIYLCWKGIYSHLPVLEEHM